ncbi:MAG: tellurite resistance TerB family protein [Myxococcales bacterium]|nr:tellurite resistance TerB family protein [Myxococcales bacterium]
MGVDQSLLTKIASSLRIARGSIGPAEAGAADRIAAADQAAETNSILSRAAKLYGTRPTGEEDTPPTGFDPAAAALFEALVEGAFLVAHADGEFDDDERAAFEQVVLAATDRHVDAGQVAALLHDLDASYMEDGADRRIQFVARTVPKPEQQHEVLRVAALIGHISGGVSDVERATMEKLAEGFGLDRSAVERAIAAARAAVG